MGSGFYVDSAELQHVRQQLQQLLAALIESQGFTMTPAEGLALTDDQLGNADPDMGSTLGQVLGRVDLALQDLVGDANRTVDSLAAVMQNYEANERQVSGWFNEILAGG